MNPRYARLSEKAAFAVELLDLPSAVRSDGVSWEDFQLDFLSNEARFGITVKSRQVGWSWTAALDALVDSVFNPGVPYIFVSVNQTEAKEKIRYAKHIIAAFDDPVRKAHFELARDSQTEIELKNGTRLVSHPCKPPRGKARARLYYDEMAHYPTGLDRQIYNAGLPATVKGDGYIRLGSSPMGASGLFWEIFTEQLRTYPGFDDNRQRVVWWESKALCNDVERAKEEAPEMSTAERVAKFGSPALKEIFANMFLEAFQQEYECDWVDESVSWISWDTIKANQSAALKHWKLSSLSDVQAAIPEIKRAISKREIERSFTAGVDIGRRKDLTELNITGATSTGQYPTRIMLSLDRVKFERQYECIALLFDKLPITRALIDESGLGMQLAENLSQEFFFCEGVSFTNQAKEAWAVEARLQAERGNTPLPVDRDLAYQIHSIRQMQTATKKSKFDTEGNKEHHADKFWAWALSIYANKSKSGIFVY